MRNFYEKPMNWKDWVKLGIGGAAFYALLNMSGCANTKHTPKHDKEAVVTYDNSNHLLSDAGIEEMLTSSYKIVKEVTYRQSLYDSNTNAFISSEIKQAKGWGSGIVCDDDDGKLYAITCAHVTGMPKDGSQEGKIWKEGHELSVRVEHSVLDTKHYIETDDGGRVPFRLVAADEGLDVAVCELEKGVSNDFDGKFAENKRVNYGDAAYVVGYPGSLGKILTQGVISNPRGEGELWSGASEFYLSTPAINPGNSGGPMFLLDNGEPVFAGMAQFKYQGIDGVYGFVKIDTIKKFLKAQGLESLIE
jgi:S1-C subfamily serine protease